MNLTEIEKIMSAHTDIHICPICSTPYAPRHARQKTCGSERCKKAYHNDYVKKYNARRRAENPEVMREYNAKQMRKYRQKQKELERRSSELEELGERWSKQAEFDRKIAEYGHKYGEVSAQKVLEKVPKIVVKGENDDRVEIKSDTE